MNKLFEQIGKNQFRLNPIDESINSPEGIANTIIKLIDDYKLDSKFSSEYLGGNIVSELFTKYPYDAVIKGLLSSIKMEGEDYFNNMVNYFANDTSSVDIKRSVERYAADMTDDIELLDNNFKKILEEYLKGKGIKPEVFFKDYILELYKFFAYKKQKGS